MDGAGAPEVYPHIDVHSGERGDREWRELFARFPRSNIYLHPDVAIASLQAPPTVLGHRVRTPNGAGLDAALVLAPRRLKLGGGHAGKMLALSGLRVVGETILGDPPPSVTWELVSEAIARLRAGAGDYLLFEDVEIGSPLWEQLHTLPQSGARRYYLRSVTPHWWIRFPEGSDRDPDRYWKSQFSGKSRQTLRRKLRKFEHTLRRYTERHEVEAFLAAASEVSRRSWQAKRIGPRMRDNDAERRRLKALADVGALRSYVLEHGDRPVAFLTGMQWAGRFLFDEAGFDSEFRSGSPGTVLLTRAIEDLLRERPPELLDFGLGDLPHKHQFGNMVHDSAPVMFVVRAVRPTLVIGAAYAGRRLFEGTRGILRRAGVYESIQRMYRR